MLTYGSVCSGIEAASVAWEPLGWRPAWFAEIEKFPSAVLAHHWPEVVNLGDMTKIAAGIRSGLIEAPDVLVGGTPCQAFSVAGLRGGLSDARGQLTLAFVELVNAIDEKRREQDKPPVIVVWENVPGVLSSKDNAFGCFLAGLAGESRELQHTGKKWTNAGCVYGPARAVAWRVLDAQYFGVAQRRRRTFVIASARTDFYPAAIFFEFDGVRRDIAPSRGEGEEIAGTLKARAKSGGWSQDVDMAAGGYMRVVGSHWDDPGLPHPTLNQSHNTGGIGASNQEVFSQRGAGLVASGGPVAYSATSRTLLAKQNSSMSEDLDTYVIDNSSGVVGAIAAHSFTGGAGGRPEGAAVGHYIPVGVFRMMAFGQYADDETASTVKSRDYKDATDLAVMAIHGTQDPCVNQDVAHPVGRNQGQENACIAFSYKDHGQDAGYEVAPTLRAGNSVNGRGNSGQPPAVANEMRVRRLTPRECERLQGFPDDHTLIPYGSFIKPEKMDRDYAKYLMRGGKFSFDYCCRAAADGPRYKAIGNSMAVPVMHWIGKRINDYLNEAA